MAMVSEADESAHTQRRGEQAGTNPISSLDSYSPKSLLVAFANIPIITFCAESREDNSYSSRYGGCHILCDSCLLRRISSQAEGRSPSFT